MLRLYIIEIRTLYRRSMLCLYKKGILMNNLDPQILGNTDGFSFGYQ
jgi:hypothetical protein